MVFIFKKSYYITIRKRGHPRTHFTVGTSLEPKLKKGDRLSASEPSLDKIMNNQIDSTKRYFTSTKYATSIKHF